MPTFDEWLLDRGPAMLTFAWLVTRNPQAARAVLQEALAEVDHRWEHFRSIDDAEGHLRRAVVHAAASHEVVAAPAGASWGPVDDVERAWLASADLSPRQRAVVALRYAEQISPADIARLLDVSEQSVRDDLNAALDHVRATTGEHR